MVHGAVFLGHRDALEPGGKPLHDVFLKDSLLTDAAIEPLERDGSPEDVRKHQRRDHLVIRSKIGFGNAVIREENFLRVRDDDVLHELSRTHSRGRLSVRTSMSRECRSLPCSVHSMNDT